MAVLTTPIPAATKNEIPERTLLAGLALTSFAALLLELALTRLFSVVLFYHFAFLAISIALLGLGAGGVFAYLLKNRLAQVATRTLASRLCMANAALIVVVLEIVLRVPVALNISGKNFLHLTVLYLAAAVPFFLTGLLFSVVFARETTRIPRLYGADLCGGALACLAIVPLLNWLGGPNAILVAGISLAAAAIIWAESRSTRRNAGLLGLALVALTAANYSGRLIDVVYAKGMFRDPAWVEFARWNALSRVEVDRQGQAKAIVIDADASTYIMNADVKQWHDTDWEKNLMSAPPALANVLRPHGDFAIIGPGGGVDVLRAVANGSASVTGIEINPIIATTIMRGRYAEYAQHLYERPDVHIQVTDGRSFLRASPERFDVVQMTLVDTWASTAAGAFALSENNLYTEEAFREYFDHLKPDGMIAITRWEFQQPREALRVVAVAMQALHRLGVANPARNFIVTSQGSLDEDGIPVVVLAKKTPFTSAEEDAVAEHCDRYSELDPLYLPTNPGQNPFSDLIASNDPHAFARQYAYNVSPVSDNAEKDQTGEGTLFCWDRRGTELWKFHPSRLLECGRKVFSPDYRISGFYCRDIDGDGKEEIVVKAFQAPDWPCLLAVLDSSGKMIGEFWNAGYLTDLTFWDINGDGRDELIVCGVNNEYRGGCLMVFDPRHISGASPQSGEFFCKGLGPGSMLYYVTTPYADVSRANGDRVDGLREVDVTENAWIRSMAGNGLIYEFDFGLRCVQASWGNSFAMSHDDLRRSGAVSSELGPAYADDLKRGIRYWDGQAWTAEPTPVKR